MTLRIEDGRAHTSLASTLADFGFAHPEEKLFPLSRMDAAQLLIHLIARDQAYGAPTDALDLAELCARDFLSLFPEESQFLTNSPDPIGAESRGWRPLTDATFDAGVVVVSEHRVGALWFEDED
jgi:hypothetical protein